MKKPSPEEFFFGSLFKELLDRRQYNPDQVARLTVGRGFEIPKKTIRSWYDGHVSRPRNWVNIICVAEVIHLERHEVDLLLEAAGYSNYKVTNLLTLKPSEITELPNLAKNEVEKLVDLLRFWRNKLSVPPPQPPNIGEFIGRKGILAQVKKILFEDKKLCVLQGMGGIGKTWIAAWIAHNLQKEFSDGVLWADLTHTQETTSSSEDVIEAILKSFAGVYGYDLNQEDLDLRRLSPIVRGMLAKRHVLIVLDNVNEAEEVEWFLPSTMGNWTALITTRNQLTLSRSFRSIRIEPFTELEALSLLEAFIGTKRVKSEINEATKLAEIAGRLPLAISLIGSTLAKARNSLTLAEYHDLLLVSKRKLLLADTYDSQKSLDIRASFEVSFEQLHDDLKSLFVILSVFSGSDFDVESVSAITGTAPVVVKYQLAELQARTLIDILGDLPLFRYQFHHVLLRQFAFEKLQKDESLWIAVNETVSTYFVSFAQENQEDFNQIHVERENILGVMNWLQERAVWGQMYQAINALTLSKLGALGYLDTQANWAEASSFLASVLDSPIAEADALVEANITFKLGAFALRKNKTDDAQNYLRKAETILGEVPETEEARLLLARVYEFKSQLAMYHNEERALQHVDQGLEVLAPLVSEEATNEKGYLYIRGTVPLILSHDLSKAMDYIEKGMELLSLEATSARISALMNQGIILDKQRKIDEAVSTWHQGVELAEKFNDRRRLGGLWNNMGAAETNRGNMKRAILHKKKALEAFEIIVKNDQISLTHSNLGEDYIFLREYEQAEMHLQAALQLAREYNFIYSESLTLVNYVRYYLDLNNFELAGETITKTRELCKKHEAAQQHAELDRLHAELIYLQGNPEASLRELDSFLPSLTDPKEQGLSWRLKGDCLTELDRLEKASTAYEKSQIIFKEFNPFEVARTQLIWGQNCASLLGEVAAQTKIRSALSVFETLEMVNWVQIAKDALDELNQHV